MMKYNYEEAIHELKVYNTIIRPGIFRGLNWIQTLLINAYILIEFAMHVSSGLVVRLITQTILSPYHHTNEIIFSNYNYLLLAPYFPSYS